LTSKGKSGVGHLVALNQEIALTVYDIDNNHQLSRNDSPEYFLDDSLRLTFSLINTQEPLSIFQKELKLSGDIDTSITNVSLTFDSLLTFILESNYTELAKNKNSFDLIISIGDPAGNNNEIEVFFSVDLSGQAVGDEFFNYPNPFSNLNSEQTNIRYVLLKGQESGVLYILDLGGDMIHMSELEESYLTSGSHEIRWDGHNMNGDLVSSGVYLGLLKIGESNKKIKIVIRN
jgi:hypothetical protein